jgi:SAM-dependent methyltransferase
MISETGAWNIQGSKFDHEHVYDSVLSSALVKFAKKQNVSKSYDFGCGPGKYVEEFRKNGIEASGYDGNPITSQIKNCSVQDLTSEFQLDPVDFLLCLEVCEHVPKTYEDSLLKTINRHVNPGGTLILSWAVIGQGGFGHVNCQNNDYVINKFKTLGYEYNEIESLLLRSEVSNATWFRNTILVFNKKWLTM